jgi:glycosyltransferase involved in cell wall biosynthesis
MKNFNARSEQAVELSIVATAYNGAEILRKFVEEVESVVAPLELSYEIILVDDGSKDDSASVIETLCETNSKLKAVLLSKNHGQQIAMSSGIHASLGRYVVIMDGDMQNPSSAIPELYARAKAGADIVYCVSNKRNGIFDAMASRFMWFVLGQLLNVQAVPNQIMMRIMCRRLVDVFKRYGERVRTVGGITHDIGMKFEVLEVENRRRQHGKSNYSFIRRFNLSIDFVLELTTAPLNLLIYVGLLVLAATTVLSSVYLYRYFSGGTVPGFTTLILSVFFFGSLNVVIFGIIGRYLANIYHEVRARPLFVVSRFLNLEEAERNAVLGADA